MLTGSLDAHALEQGRRALSMCEQMPSLAFIDRIYLHWSVEEFHCVDGSYNFVVRLSDDDTLWIVEHPTSNILNATIPEGEGYAEHTYYRNGHAIGIAIDGMDGRNVSHSNFGKDAIQLHEVEVLCSAAAGVAQFYRIDASGRSARTPFANEPTIMTHAEASFHTGDPQQYTDYFGERWDLERLKASPDPLSRTRATQTGDLLRQRIHEYKVALNG